MIGNFVTLTEFILGEEKKFASSTGSLTLVLTHLEDASKIIASHIKKTGLVDILGKTGEQNAYHEDVKKLDQFANDLLVGMLLGTGHVSAVFSEELSEPERSKDNKGEYVVFFDPLDGSSNIEVGISVGTIFSIYRADDVQKNLLPASGAQQVAAGYILYGSSVIFVYTAGSGVNGFTLDPSIGTFLLSHPSMNIPQKGSIYTMNESYWNRYHPYQKAYLDHIKQEDPKTNRPYSSRLAACMVADVHRVLIDGGIFIYPENTVKLDGKLRLMYEVNPMAFVVQQAGGAAVSLAKDPLSITPATHDIQVPIVLGSKDNVAEYLSFYESAS